MLELNNLCGTDIPTVSIEATQSDFLQAESTVVSKADSIPESSGNFLNPEPKPASGLTINPESSSNNPSPGSTFRGPSSKNLGSQNSYASTAERSNKGPNPFQDAQYDNSGRSVSPFGEHALSPFSNDAQRATSMRRSSEASHSSHMAPAPSSAMRMQANPLFLILVHPTPLPLPTTLIHDTKWYNLSF